MVATATVADMVPLAGRNRNLLYYGLKGIKTQRPGLLSFYRRLKLSAPNIKEDDLAYDSAKAQCGRSDGPRHGQFNATTESSQEAN